MATIDRYIPDQTKDQLRININILFFERRNYYNACKISINAYILDNNTYHVTRLYHSPHNVIFNQVLARLYST